MKRNKPSVCQDDPLYEHHWKGNPEQRWSMAFYQDILTWENHQELSPKAHIPGMRLKEGPIIFSILEATKEKMCTGNKPLHCTNSLMVSKQNQLKFLREVGASPWLGTFCFARFPGRSLPPDAANVLEGTAELSAFLYLRKLQGQGWRQNCLCSLGYLTG